MTTVKVHLDPSSDIDQEIANWESLGFYYKSQKKLEKHLIELTFEGGGTPIASKKAEYFLNFNDGTSSRLYVRGNALDDE
jgi:hypothetical protein